MKIVVDSGCDISEEVRTRISVKIEVAPLTLRIGEEVFTDNGSMDIDSFLSLAENSKSAVQSASPSPQEFVDTYAGNENVCVVTLSSHLSGSFNSANLAKQLYTEEAVEKPIHIFDSLSASSGETLIALKIGELAESKLPVEEVILKTNHFISGLKTYFMLGNYDTAVRSGRMEPYVAKIASLLNIKPICGGVEGRMVMLDKAHGAKRAVQRLIDIMAAETVDFKDRILAISHCQCVEKAVSLKDEIMSRIPFKGTLIMETSGLCSTYVGRGGIVAAF